MVGWNSPLSYADLTGLGGRLSGEEASLNRHPGVGEDVEEASLGMGLQVGEVLARGGDRAACLGRRATLLLLDAASRRSRARPTRTATR